MEREPLLKEVLERLERVEGLEEKILRYVEPRLSSIQMQFTLSTASQRGTTMTLGNAGAPVAGPLTLVLAGQTAIASVIGFDQLGNPWTGAMPPAVFTDDDTAGAIIILADNGDGTDTVTAVANGVANVTATVQTTDGNGNPITLTDTEAVTVAIPVVPPPTPILSSIKVAFDTGGPTPPVAAKKK